ncbi:MAG: hypothetical protein JWO03_2915 [Bacteroidetes bacterium]|nr:hypothetical protein [Bacteroidota bacterium]
MRRRFPVKIRQEQIPILKTNILIQKGGRNSMRHDFSSSCGMPEDIQTQCCIAGGGPAGIMLGYLLARAGVDVVVLEKHADFFRDFRGDTIHPSTMEVLYELGILDAFLRVPHQALYELYVRLNGEHVKVVDFSHLPVHCQYIALMPQWDFLSFLAEAGQKFPSFHLYKNAEVTGLIHEGAQVRGVRARTPGGEQAIYTPLTVGADGRDSVVRLLAGLEVIESGVPIDVLWLRIPKGKEIKEQTLGYFKEGKTMVLIDRDEYYQCGYIIAKGAYEEIRARGLESFRADVLSLAPFLRGYVDAINSWDDIKLLTVQINHLSRWYTDGLLCIGDAAHAMSPAGGVGINLAIQDAVAAANILSGALKKGNVTTVLLKKVQQRREMPARVIQRIQEFIHDKFINAQYEPGPGGNKLTSAFVWVLRHIPILQRIPARVVGMGLRPEHVR